MLLQKNIPFQYIFGKIKTELLLIAVYALVIELLYSNFHVTKISIPIAIPTVLGTVLSLLLGFRSNQAYDRWWEARHIWGAIVNDSRSLARQVLSFTQVSYDQEDLALFQQRFIHRQMAWCFSLSRKLRGQDALEGMDKYLGKRDYEHVARYSNAPVAMLELHGRDLSVALNNGWLNSYQQVEIDKTISRLCDSMGKCERIKNTVFPATYSLYIHFALLLFIGLLPFGVIEYVGFFEIPLVVAISASFLLIEKMAIHLQDPFENKPTDTPMTAISGNIESDLRQMLREYAPAPSPVTNRTVRVKVERAAYYIL